jgi:hypothetical protein
MNNSRIVRLLKILASSPEPSRGFETPEDEFERYQRTRHKALLELARLQHDPAVWQMLTRVTREISPSGNIEGFLQHRTAGRVLSFALLDTILKQFNIGRQISLTTAPVVTEANLDDLRDDQVADLYNRTRVEYAKSRR